MRRLLYIVILFLLYTNIGIADDRVKCHQGNQTPNHFDNPTNHPGGSFTSAGAISADPNEITGPAGYDTVRWVSSNDVLSYTIFFENNPEFATAAAQKVNIDMTF